MGRSDRGRVEGVMHTDKCLFWKDPELYHAEFVKLIAIRVRDTSVLSGQGDFKVNSFELASVGLACTSQSRFVPNGMYL